ncbi:MAG: S8 family serine peptidase, partial [Phycisphaerae bacterium]
MRLCAQFEKCWRSSGSFVSAVAVVALAFGVPAARALSGGDQPAWPKAIPVGSSLENVPSVDFGDGQGERVSVLVHFDPSINRGAVQRTNVQTFSQQFGAYQKYDYSKVLPNVVNIRDLPLSQLPALRRMPGVVRVERDKIVHAYMDDSTPLIRALQSQITGAGLNASGANVRVCIIDTGIDSDNQMYAARIDTAAGRDFVNNDNNPEDDNGHGSHVAGTAVGGTGISRTVCGTSRPFQGIAPNATLIGVKVLDAAGSGTFSNVIAGINYCADQTGAGGQADIISMSLGGGQFAGTCDSDSGAAAANNAVNAGVVVVAASGNDGFANAMGTPACGSQVISVGATYDADFPNCANSSSSFNWGICVDNNPTVDSLVCFSNKSDFLDVVAPGCDTFSASNAAGGTSITSKCGTSMATPHVAGLAALILSADPTLTPAEVRQIIRDGALDLGATGFDRSFGFGRIDAINSLQLVGPGCATNADCDDGDPCTTDVCSAGSCSFTPISCPPGQTCIGGTCQGQGACCTGQSCSIDNPAACAASGGFYMGDGTDCGSGTAGNPTVYQNAPGATIPDGGGAGNPATDTINVPDSVVIGDIDVDLDISHTWVGDLTVTVSHLGTTVTVIDRPGVPASSFGCSNDNFSGIILDDEGTGGAIESQCATNLSSPPNYTPEQSLSAFDGMDSAGAWVITVYDSVSADGGTLNSWSLHIDSVGNNPCTGGCQADADCDDGIFCNGAEVCSAGTCVAGTAVDCNDAVACTTDSCNEATNSCDNTPDDAACDNGLFCDGAETCNATLGCQAGTAVDCNDAVACTTDSCNEATNSCDNTPSDAACDNGQFCDGAETCNA